MSIFKIKTIAFLLAACSFAFADEYHEIPQKVDGCYQISTAQELNGFVRIVNGWYGLAEPAACGVLTADISLIADEYGWEPIEVFSGVFDGKGNTISNMGVGGG